MKDVMEKRLEELKGELAAGEKLLGELQAKQATVQQTMLRIAGAIQVLEEMLGYGEGAEQGSSANGKDTSHP